MALVEDESGSGKWFRWAHAVLAVAWTAMIPVSILTGLRNSVPYLVAISVYALAVGHASSWQSCRAEAKADDTSDG